MIVIYLAFLHFVADFILQDRDMRKRKSESLKVLFNHCMFQFWVFYGGLLLLDYDHKAIFLFVLLNTLIHGVIDWNIWRFYKAYTFNRLHNQASAATWMNGNLNIPHEDRTFEKFNELAKNFKFWEDHYFYVTIGFDQFLHLATIVGLWYFIVGG